MTERTGSVTANVKVTEMACDSDICQSVELKSYKIVHCSTISKCYGEAWLRQITS